MSRTTHHGNKAKQRKFGDFWWAYGTTPSWWNRMMHNRPKRVEHRRMEQRVLRGEYEQVWPLDRKPHDYYW